MADYWNNSWKDWLGIIIFNSGILFLATGLWGLWESFEEVGSVAKTLLIGLSWLIGLGLIYV